MTQNELMHEIMENGATYLRQESGQIIAFDQIHGIGWYIEYPNGTQYMLKDGETEILLLEKGTLISAKRTQR